MQKSSKQKFNAESAAMVLWQIKQQWHRSLAYGYTVSDASRTLGSIVTTGALPYSLRRQAHELQMEVINGGTRQRKKKQEPTINTVVFMKGMQNGK